MNHKAILAAWIMLSMLVVGLASIPPASAANDDGAKVHGGADRAYGLTLASTARGGFTADTDIHFNLSNRMRVWDYHAAAVREQVTSDQLIVLNNTGTESWGTWWINVSCNNTALDLSAPGSWYVSFDEYDNYTTSEETITCAQGTELGNNVFNEYNYTEQYSDRPSINQSAAGATYNAATGQYTVLRYAKTHNAIPNCSPVVFNCSVTASGNFCIDLSLVMDQLPAAGTYNITYTIRGFAGWSDYVDWRDNRTSRAVTSDPVTGSTLLTVLPVLDFSIKYSGTHTADLYFPSAAGTSTTVYSANNLIVENQGNLAISKVKFDVGVAATKWAVIAGSATTYAAYDNSYIRKQGTATYDQLGTSDPEYAYSPAIATASDPLGGVLNYREFDMKISNMALSTGNYSYSALKITCSDSTGVYTKDLYALMKLTVYSGNLGITISYSAGTALSWPSMNPGQADTYTSNSVVIANSATSDYSLNKVMIALAPMTSATNTLSFGERAQVAFTYSGSTFYYDLASYNTNGINYGRCLIDCGGTAQPAVIAAGTSASFSVKLKLMPTAQAPGSYTGSFIIECSANPIATGSGVTGLTTSGIVDQTLAARATPNPAILNQSCALSATLSWPAASSPWAYVSFTLTAPNGTILALRHRLVIDAVESARAANPTATTLSIIVDGGNFTPTTAGNYALAVTQGTVALNGNIVACGATNAITIVAQAASAAQNTTPAATLPVAGTYWARLTNWTTAQYHAHPYLFPGSIALVILVIVGFLYMNPRVARRFKFAIAFGALFGAACILPMLASTAAAEAPDDNSPVVLSIGGDAWNMTLRGYAWLSEKGTAAAAYMQAHACMTVIVLVILAALALYAIRHTQHRGGRSKWF